MRVLVARILPIGLLVGPNAAATTCKPPTQIKGLACARTAPAICRQLATGESFRSNIITLSHQQDTQSIGDT